MGSIPLVRSPECIIYPNSHEVDKDEAMRKEKHNPLSCALCLCLTLLLAGSPARADEDRVAPLEPGTAPANFAADFLWTADQMPIKLRLGFVSTDEMKMDLPPGAKFALASPMAVTASAEKAGYATIVFQDAQQKGLMRSMLWFGPSVENIGATTTDAQGRVQLAIPYTMAPGKFEVRAAFVGSQTDASG
jgi:hypothetical protein